MNNHFFSDYFAKLQDMNQLWLKELDSGKAAMNTPVTKALNEMSLEDTTQFLEKAAAQPGALAKVHMDWWENQLKIWQNVAVGKTTAENAIIKPAKDDKRFSDPAWENEAFYNYIKQSYLLFSDTMRETIDSLKV